MYIYRYTCIILYFLCSLATLQGYVYTHALLPSAGQDYNTISFRTNREERHIGIAEWLASSQEPGSFDVLRPILFDLLKRRETWDDTVEMLNFCIEQKGLQKELGRISTKQLFAALYQAFCIGGCKVGCKLENTNEEMKVRKQYWNTVKGWK